ncbi:RNA polymerase sigma factor [Thiosulfatimonas sediminis]|uniref:RNA polymerase sigma factor n=1 Tax=Thiosulfatimonas sediminis TaxID=2675054 RepID=A0A6F8PVQ9_9GAMM|nr:sigma-70 family RNA polymerase sigma factor [Thiosulfatimonas sediminis]BBP46199.1 RNA polymerase sigma factor [Thiosulfatimonas sediminis]
MSFHTPTQDPFAQQIAPLRPRLLAFARLHLNCSEDCDDLVQETLFAAWHRYAQFQGKSTLETWVFAILRRKLIDLYRQRSKIQIFEYDENQLPDTDTLFQEDEHWQKVQAPTVWPTPYKQMENEHFWQVFDLCIYHLPEQTSRVFSLHELLGFDTQQICETLQISEQNCWTILHRARLKLRACLEKNWFSPEESSK